MAQAMCVFLFADATWQKEAAELEESLDFLLSMQAGMEEPAEKTGVRRMVRDSHVKQNKKKAENKRKKKTTSKK